MKVYESNFDYNYSFPAVTLAFFLRYPNPYSKHVLSTDVIDRYLDEDTQRLHTIRLHLKKSKVPSGILRLLPRGLAGPGGSSESFVLEKSTIDIREGWMQSESRNLEWTGVLSVIEKQSYRRHNLQDIDVSTQKSSQLDPSKWTKCKTTVTFVSKFGQAKLLKKGNTDSATSAEEAPKQGFFAAWSTAGIQRTIEAFGVKRAQSALLNGNEGMKVVLQRLRSGGVIGVLEGMRRDRMEAMGGEGGLFKQTLLASHEGRGKSIEDESD